MNPPAAVAARAGVFDEHGRPVDFALLSPEEWERVAKALRHCDRALVDQVAALCERYGTAEDVEALRRVTPVPGGWQDFELTGAPVLEKGGAVSPWPGAGFVRLSDVVESQIEWLWSRRIARGNVVVLAGDGGLGKSTLGQEIGARVTKGDPLPGGVADRPRGVLILTSEEHTSAVITPRMRLMGADLERVAVLDPDEAQMTFPSGGDLLERVCRDGDVGLVLIDTGPAFMDADLSSNREEHIRQFLRPLKQTAERLDLVVIVIAHLNKASGMAAGDRVMGGKAWRNAPRQMLIVGPPPNTDPRSSGERLVAVEKSNLGSYPPAVAFSLVPAPGDPSRAVVEWGGEVEGVTTADLVASSTEGASGDDEDADVLLDILADGPLGARDFENEAREAGISKHRFEEVRAALKRDGRIEREQVPRVGSRGAARWLWMTAGSTPPTNSPGVTNSTEGGGVEHPRNDGDLGGVAINFPVPAWTGGVEHLGLATGRDLRRWDQMAIDEDGAS